MEKAKLDAIARMYVNAQLDELIMRPKASASRHNDLRWRVHRGYIEGICDAMALCVKGGWAGPRLRDAVREARIALVGSPTPILDTPEGKAAMEAGTIETYIGTLRNCAATNKAGE